MTVLSVVHATPECETEIFIQGHPAALHCVCNRGQGSIKQAGEGECRLIRVITIIIALLIDQFKSSDDLILEFSGV